MSLVFFLPLALSPDSLHPARRRNSFRMSCSSSARRRTPCARMSVCDMPATRQHSTQAPAHAFSVCRGSRTQTASQTASDLDDAGSRLRAWYQLCLVPARATRLRCHLLHGTTLLRYGLHMLALSLARKCLPSLAGLERLECLGRTVSRERAS